MANLCTNSIALIGKPENLNHLVDIIKQVANTQEYVTPEAIQEFLGFTKEGWGRSYDNALGKGLSGVNTERINDGVLFLDCTTAWGAIDEYWAELCLWLNLKGFASFSETDDDLWTTNDPEGIWFPEKYLYDDYGELEAIADYEYFNCEEDVATHLNKASGENKTFDEWVEYLEDNECYGIIKTIEKGGSQVYPYKAA